MTHQTTHRRRWRPVILLGLIAAGVLLLALVAGSVRYGGPDGLLLRVRLALAQEAPHPVFVPTPLPVNAGAIQAADLVPALGTATVAPDLSNPKQARVTTVLPLVIPTDDRRAAATRTPAPTPTPQPTAAPTSPPATPTAVPRAPTVALAGLRHEWQTWNNCGPATLSYNLSYFGSPLRQEAVRQATRPNKEDKNVNPDELAAFAQSQGYHAIVRVDGSAEQLRTLVASGIPVMVETWLEPKPNDGMGHYRLVTGYDDATREWIVYDSYVSHGISKSDPYRGIRIPYQELADLWRVFNRTYLIVYTDELVPPVEAILGSALDEAIMWQQALAHAQAEIANNPRDAFAWFNLGSTLTALQRYDEAAAAFDQARQIGLPWRMLWYQFAPFRAYSEVGRHSEVLALAEATLATTQDIEELHYWRGRALQALGQLDGARAAYDRAVALNPFFTAAADARRTL